MERQIQVGEIVRRCGKKQKMTVEKILASTKRAQCAWFEGITIKRAHFPISELESC